MGGEYRAVGVHVRAKHARRRRRRLIRIQVHLCGHEKRKKGLAVGRGHCSQLDVAGLKIAWSSLCCTTSPARFVASLPLSLCLALSLSLTHSLSLSLALPLSLSVSLSLCLSVSLSVCLCLSLCLSLSLPVLVCPCVLVVCSKENDRDRQRETERDSCCIFISSVHIFTKL